MAKIKPIEIIASMSGKVCTHGDMYFSTNKQTGRIHTGKMCNPSTAEPTAKQLAVREKFKQRRTLTSAWMVANKPTDASPKGTDIYQKALAAYKAQHDIGSFFGYIASIIDDDGKVTIGNANGNANGNTNPNANGNTSQGGDTSGGGSSSGGGGEGGLGDDF